MRVVVWVVGVVEREAEGVVWVAGITNLITTKARAPKIASMTKMGIKVLKIGFLGGWAGVGLLISGGGGGGGFTPMESLGGEGGGETSGAKPCGAWGGGGWIVG